jgi:hypothetical protein
LPPVIPLLASSQVGPDHTVSRLQDKKEDIEGSPHISDSIEVMISSSTSFTKNIPERQSPKSSNSPLFKSSIKFREIIKTNLFGSNASQTPPKKQEIAQLKLVLSPPTPKENLMETKDDNLLPLPPTEAQQENAPSEAELQAIRERIALLESKL